MIPIRSFQIVAVWCGRKSIKKEWKFYASPLPPTSCVAFEMLHSLSGLHCPQMANDDELDDIENLFCFRLYSSHWFPLNIWSHVYIMGWWMKSIHHLIDFLSPSLNCKFREGRVCVCFICAVITEAPTGSEHGGSSLLNECVRGFVFDESSCHTCQEERRSAHIPPSAFLQWLCQSDAHAQSMGTTQTFSWIGWPGLGVRNSHLWVPESHGC